MNYFFALMICFAMTGLAGTEENARWLLICDINVALYLALAWFLDHRKRSGAHVTVRDMQSRLDMVQTRSECLEQLLREIYRHPDVPGCISERVRKALVNPFGRCP